MSSTPHSTPRKSPKKSVRSSRRLKGSEMPSWKVLLAESDPKKSKKKEEQEEEDDADVEQDVVSDHEPDNQSYEEEQPESVASGFDDDSDDDAPEAVSMSSAKQMALEAKKRESQSQKAYKQEQKDRARKLFHSDNVRPEKKEATKISFLDDSLFDELEEDETKKEEEEKVKKEERKEKRKRKREAEEAKERAQRPKKKTFDSVEVVLSNEVGGRSINSRAKSRLNRHYRKYDRSTNFLSSSRSHAPSSSFA